ncbi:MAG: thioredoxin protein [Ferruginibacter sp.]|nr:thioredoxin protein [Ferruginibacter sp.]
MDKKFTNRLIKETSPYLLQHAHNPVDWYPWGEEALSRAKNENKVILVSIGYSACHWCHVMERESFENESVAAMMNEHFINIKIDREERPDLDHIYMDAVQAISGSGGWPLNVFLTPATKPFFGGTYFPPVKAYNRSSWTEILQAISQAWKDRSNEIEAQADNLTEHLKGSNLLAQTKKDISVSDGENSITIDQCDSMFSAIMESADTEWGGFGKAPKFPQTFTIQFLFQYYYFTNNGEALTQALLSLDKMLMGGIYDHVGGGLARYSTDREWLAPHFEKMLYDNALLINILCDAYQLTSDKKYEEAIHKTISFIKDELLSEQGGFYAALDADSEGEEGKYYVWEKAEIDRLLGNNAELFAEFFDVSEEGNWEGKNILRILKPVDVFVEEKQLQKQPFLLTIQNCLDKLSQERSLRIKPALDDKILLGWNALMIKAVAKAATVLRQDAYRNMAIDSFNFLQTNFRTTGTISLLHTYKNGIGKYPAFLDDYAYLISAAIQLYNATFNTRYLQMAYDYCNYVIDNFGDEDATFFFFTEERQKDVIVRKKEIYDGATPSGNAIMAENLFRLSVIYDKVEWRERAEKMCGIISSLIIKYPGSFGIWAALLLQMLKGANEVAVVGKDFHVVSNNILLNFVPNLVLMASDRENEHFPLLANKAGKVAATQIFLCKNYACMAPFLDSNLMLKQIAKSDKITR